MSASPFTSETRISDQPQTSINSKNAHNFAKRVAFFDIIIAIAVAYSVFFVFYFNSAYAEYGNVSILGPACVSLVYALLKFSRRGYTAREYLDLKRYLSNVIVCWSGALIFVVVVYAAFGVGAYVSRDWLAASFVFGLVFLPLGRTGIALLAKGDLAEPQASFRNVFMISADRDAATADILRSAFDEGIRFVGVRYLSDSDNSIYSVESCEALVDEIRDVLKERNIDEINLHLPQDETDGIKNFASAFAALPIRVLLISRSTAKKARDTRAIGVGHHVAIELLRAPISARGHVAKRMLDIVVASAALLVLLPVIAIACIGIAIESGRPIIFRQNRKGVAGRPFTIFKLRTMSVQENGDKIVQACRNDPRVTRLGAILRRTSIDELPQLLNVLRGDMSIVGPRPHALAHDTYYGELIKEYTRRHNVKPGLTGWAQVNGFRGETKDLHAMSERIRHDIWYIENWSIWLDIRIIFKTAGCVLFQKQAY